MVGQYDKNIYRKRDEDMKGNEKWLSLRGLKNLL